MPQTHRVSGAQMLLVAGEYRARCCGRRISGDVLLKEKTCAVIAASEWMTRGLALNVPVDL